MVLWWKLLWETRDEDPVLVIPDILPHLGRKIQMSKTMDEAIPGESLDVVIGSVPLLR